MLNEVFALSIVLSAMMTIQVRLCVSVCVFASAFIKLGSAYYSETTFLVNIPQINLFYGGKER